MLLVEAMRLPSMKSKSSIAGKQASKRTINTNECKRLVVLCVYVYGVCVSARENKIITNLLERSYVCRSPLLIIPYVSDSRSCVSMCVLVRVYIYL